jgi:hypothetical protein
VREREREREESKKFPSSIFVKVVELSNQNEYKKKHEQKLKTDKQYKRRQKRQGNKLKKL